MSYLWLLELNKLKKTYIDLYMGVFVCVFSCVLVCM